jgi:uncharacterized MAPEG superfamily protein
VDAGCDAFARVRLFTGTRAGYERPMHEVVAPYHEALVGYVILGALVLVQALVGDVAGIRARHVPGMPVTGGHDVFHFRATRALANTNENLGGFLLVSLAAILLGASPTWTNRLVMLFAASRAGHMLAYYADLRTVRSLSFGVGLVCLVGLAICAAATLG